MDHGDRSRINVAVKLGPEIILRIKEESRESNVGEFLKRETEICLLGLVTGRSL